MTSWPFVMVPGFSLSLHYPVPIFLKFNKTPQKSYIVPFIFGDYLIRYMNCQFVICFLPKSGLLPRSVAVSGILCWCLCLWYESAIKKENGPSLKKSHTIPHIKVPILSFLYHFVLHAVRYQWVYIILIARVYWALTIKNYAWLAYLIFETTVRGQHHYDPHFTEEMEALEQWEIGLW